MPQPHSLQMGMLTIPTLRSCNNEQRQLIQVLTGMTGMLQTLNKSRLGTSLVAQWLGIRLPMQGTQVRALVLEDSTCCGATKPVCHNY